MRGLRIGLQEQGIVALEVRPHRRHAQPGIAEGQGRRRHRRRLLQPEPLLDLVAADDRLEDEDKVNRDGDDNA
jgi:hypothetical protein